MPTLNDYTTATQALLHDPTSSLYGVLTSYINEARTRLALQSECVRFLWTFDATRSTTASATGGYTAGTATITMASVVGLTVGMSAFSATLTDFASGTTLTAINGSIITLSPAPLATAAGPITLTFFPPLSTAVKQEVYAYNRPLFSSLLGLQAVTQVKSVAVNWGGIGGSSLVMLEQWSFTRYQAFLGYYGQNLQGNPAVWCSYQNTVMMRPVPSSVWPMQWDTICTPIALVDNSSVEAIPYPYTDSVKYYAAYLAYMNSQNSGPADRMAALYEKTMAEARSFTQRTFVPYVYR